MANPRRPAVLHIPVLQCFKKPNGHAHHHLDIAYFPSHGIPVPDPDNLVIHFQHHIVDRYYLLTDAGVVIHSSEVRKLSHQRSVFVPKYMVLCDTDDAYQMVSEEVSRFSRDAHVSPACRYRVQDVVKANLLEASYHLDEGIDVRIDRVKDHVSVMEVGDGMVPAEETAVKALLEKETTGVVESDGESCVICMEELPRGTHAVRMPCSHVFHGACIGRWLENSHYCPVCRYQMPTVT